LSLLVGLSVHLVGVRNPAGSGPGYTRALAGAALQEGEGTLRVEGRLVPGQFANLALQLNGRVEEVLVQDGAQVESDQVLVRLGGGEDLRADIAGAEMDLLQAQQALEALYENAGLQKALADRELALAQKELTEAVYHLRRVQQGAPQLAIDQAYANMRLAENALANAQDQLARTERQFDNGKDPIWLFVNRKQVKLLLTVLERNVASAQGKYEDAIQKYEDLVAPPDEVELALAEADLAVAQMRTQDAEERHTALLDGPDPDELALAQARIRVAETALEASRNALQDLELRAPFAGTVVDVTIKAGEWVEVGQVVIVLASFSNWMVETEDLTELQVPGLELGQEVTVSPQALSGVDLPGTVEAIKRISEVKSGDVTYTARIQLAETDSRLRWGMTVTVDFGR
jgi:multidrug resistance efflux pump